MVFFTCNHCGESAKKSVVDKHYNQKCRGKQVSVSCMDCMKDFYGDEYVAHTKCISEAEKYSGKGYTEKESKNKGAKKQESWMEVIRSILHTPKYNLSPRARTAFEKLQNVNNVPRKKAKFQNFVANCLHMSHANSEEIWSVLEKELEKMKTKPSNQEGGAGTNGELKSNGDENGEKSKDGNPKKALKRNPAECDDAVSPVSKKNKTAETSAEDQVAQTTKKSKNKKKLKNQAKDKMDVVEQGVNSKLETNGETENPTVNGNKSKNIESKKTATRNPAESESEEKQENETSAETQVPETHENSSPTKKKSKNKKPKKGAMDSVKTTETNVETKSTTNEKKSKGKKSKKLSKAKMDVGETNTEANPITAAETGVAADGKKWLDKKSKKAVKRNLAETKDADMSEPKKTKSSEKVAASETGDENNLNWTSEIKSIVDKHTEGIPLEKLKKEILEKYTSQLDLEEIRGKQQKKFEQKFTKYLRRSTLLHGLKLTDNIVKLC